MLEQAIALHHAGQLVEAERLYRDILRQEPENAQVGHLLGLLAVDAGLPQAAIPVLERVRMLDPGNADVYGDLGRCHLLLGQYEAALPYLDHAIALSPGFAGAHNNRGLALTSLMRFEEALDAFRQALALEPENPVIHGSMAIGLARLGRPEEALSQFDRAVELAPDDRALHYNRADILKNMRRDGDALAAYDRAISLAPDFAEAHFNRGLLLARGGRHDEALAALDSAIALRPDMVAIHVSRGLVLQQIERHDDAMAAFNRAIALRPDFADGPVARMLLLAQTGPAEDAIAYGRTLIANPAMTTDIKFQLGMLLLQQGQWDEGLRFYEARKTCSVPTETRSFPGREWLGAESLAGKTLYVHAEQGLGDTLQFCRYLPLVKALGATVIFSAPDRLMRLVAGMDSGIQILPLAAVPSAYDYHASLMSLPLAFQTRPDTVPATIPYLHAEPARVEKWRQQIGTEGFKIGICWTGNIVATNYGFGLERSVPLHEIAALGKLPGIRLINLQKDNNAALAELPAGMTVETLGADFDAGPDAFLDTAAAMQSLDLVISCDTAIAHLAGALGRPVWTALNKNAEWRWLLERSDTPWYPTMTLFRQQTANDWSGVFGAMRDKLAGMVKP